MKKKMNTTTILSLVFGCIGILYAVLGGVFLAVGQRTLDLPGLDVSGDADALPVVGAVFLVLGAVSIFVTAIIRIFAVRKARYREELLAWGTRVTGQVADIPVDRTVRVNGQSPLRILVTVTHPTTGETLTIRSGQVWETSLSNGDPVDVLFDPMDEKKYIVDVK